MDKWALSQPVAPAETVVVGLLPGEGIGPEVVTICERFLRLLEERGCFRVELSRGGPIGIEARRSLGSDFPDNAAQFSEGVFSAGGALLAGAGGGRFVYEMRRRFDLFMKVNPLRQFRGAAPSRHEFDIVIVRDNREGLYQGQSVIEDSKHGRRVRHSFQCSRRAVDEVTEQAAQLAATRRGHLTVAAKESGLPEISRLWHDSARAAGARHGVEVRAVEIDYAVYQLMREPNRFDVIAVPNCFGDILSDLGGVLMGSRGVTFGGSFDSCGRAVYQTNHGAASDLKGQGKCNPAGQLLALAMLLRHSFGREREATWIETALEETWCDGWCTFDMEELPGQKRFVCGTQRFAAEVEKNLLALISRS
jgi:3-isopropylmalate dehydrogenase